MKRLALVCPQSVKNEVTKTVRPILAVKITPTYDFEAYYNPVCTFSAVIKFLCARQNQQTTKN